MVLLGLVGQVVWLGQVVQSSSGMSSNIEDSLHVCSPTSLYTVLQGCVAMNQGDYGRAGASIGSLVSRLVQRISILSNVPSARLFLSK
jgi:hypothetical protein